MKPIEINNTLNGWKEFPGQIVYKLLGKWIRSLKSWLQLPNQQRIKLKTVQNSFEAVQS